MEEVVTEEPLPGWLRYEIPGKAPFYKSPFPRTVIRTAAMLKEFLRKEHLAGRMKGVDGSEFSFKRRLGLKVKAVPSTITSNQYEVGVPGAEALETVGSGSKYSC